MSERRPRTWAERTGGWEHEDQLGRTVQVRFSNFHGLMITTSATFLDGRHSTATVYVGDPGPLIDYLQSGYWRAPDQTPELLTEAREVATEIARPTTRTQSDTTGGEQ